MPDIREVVEGRAMKGAAVVPEGDRVFGPAEAALELGTLGMAQQHFEQRVAQRPFFMPAMRVVNPRLTNRLLRPVTGCVRTTGCIVSGKLLSERP